MGLIKDNKELDSTLSIVFTFIVFMGITGAILTMALRSLKIPPDLFTVFQSCKELVMMILSSFFTRQALKGKYENNDEVKE